MRFCTSFMVVALLGASVGCGDSGDDPACEGDDCADGSGSDGDNGGDGQADGDNGGDGQADGMGGDGGGNDGEDPITVDGEWELATGALAGLSSSCGTLLHVYPHPERDMLIAGVVNNGLWASTDGGAWTQIASSDPTTGVTNGLSRILVDPEDPDTFWESGTYGPCAYVTRDGGQTFSRLGDAEHCDSISVDFSDPDRKTILAGGHENHVVWRSTDGGETWTDVGENIPADAGATGFVLALSSEVHLVASWRDTGAGVFRTTDGGASWTKVFSGGIRSRPLVTENGDIYFVLLELEGQSGLIKSTDDGVTWEKVAGSEALISTEAGLIELPDGRLVTRGHQHLLISDDGGSSWAQLGPQLPFSPWGVAYSPFRKEFFAWYFTCAGGPEPVAENALMSLAFDHEAN